MQFGLVAADLGAVDGIAMIVRVPTSVQRYSLSPNRAVPSIVKSPCFIAYSFMVGACCVMDSEINFLPSCR